MTDLERRVPVNRIVAITALVLVALCADQSRVIAGQGPRAPQSGAQPASTASVTVLSVDQPNPAADNDVRNRLDGLAKSLTDIERTLEEMRGLSFLGRMFEAFLSQAIWSLFSSDASAGSIFAIISTLLSAVSLGVRIALRFGPETPKTRVCKTRLTVFVLAYVLLGLPAIVLLGLQRTTPLDLVERQVEGLQKQVSQATDQLGVLVTNLEKLAPMIQPQHDLAPVERRLSQIEQAVTIGRAEQASGLQQNLLFGLLALGFAGVSLAVWWLASRSGSVSQS